MGAYGCGMPVCTFMSAVLSDTMTALRDKVYELAITAVQVHGFSENYILFPLGSRRDTRAAT
jgi:hypothetical protein